MACSWGLQQGAISDLRLACSFPHCESLGGCCNTRMSFRRILPCAWLVIALLARALRADEATDRAQDIAQMKRVWEALMAYQKENGKLPDRLGALVPKHLANPKDLLSPR